MNYFIEKLTYLKLKYIYIFLITILQELLSKVILELQKDRYFETLQGRYWNSTMRNNCPVLDDSEGILNSYPETFFDLYILKIQHYIMNIFGSISGHLDTY